MKQKDTKKTMTLEKAKKRNLCNAERWESDIEMTQAASRGDASARRDLVDVLMNQVRRTVSYLANPRGDAEDLAQLALIQILNSAGSFRGECTLGYWADRITVRTAMKQFRKRQRRDRLIQTVFPEELPPRRAVDDDVALGQVRIRLSALLDKLSDDRRTAVVLHHIQGYGIAEVAQMTDAPVNTVRDRLRVGRKQLKKRAMADSALRDWIRDSWGKS
jgi:RNA polymerase sigma-70 factor, ECF subfamily